MENRYFYTITLFLCLSLAYLNCAKQQIIKHKTSFSKKVHLGNWVGTDNRRRGWLNFYSNGLASFAVGSKAFGGPNKTKDGALLYQIDYSKNPISLDLIAVDEDYLEQRRIQMIVKFITPRKMVICTFMNQTRPKNFDEKCHKIYFRK